MKKQRVIFHHPGLVALSAAILLCLGNWVCGQTQIIHDYAGDRSSETSNQPPTAPLITSQPQTVLGQIGGTYGFTVTATGVNLSYQWYKDASPIAGQISDTLTIANAQSGNFSNHASSTGLYSVRVSNSAGVVVSNAAALYLDSLSLGIPDWWQTQYFGTVGIDPNADADGDGVSNLQEYLDGTNPNDATSFYYTLTTGSPISVQPSMARYPAGSQVALTLSGAYLQNWTGDAAGSANPLTVTMTRNKSIQAVTTDNPNTHLATSLSSSANASVLSLLVQGDGSIVAGGVFDSFLGRPQWNLGRIRPNGTLDAAFFPGSQSHFQSTIYDMVQQPDGKLIVVGIFSHSPSLSGVNPPNFIARLNTDGTVDESFMAAGKYPTGSVTAVALQTDGRILIGGSFGGVGSTGSRSIARLNGDGTIDTTFAVGTGLNGTVSAGCLRVDASGSIYAGGSFADYNGTGISNVVRLQGNGSLDTGFSTGTGFDSSVTALTVRSGGGIYIGGYFTQYNGSTARAIVALTNSGAVDTSFNAGSAYTSGGVYRIAVQSDNKLVLAVDGTYWQGQASSYALRLNGNGTLDTGFSSQLDGPLYSVAIQNNGQIIVGGAFGTVNGSLHSNLARLNTDGSLDATGAFSAGSASEYFNVVGYAVQTDGKLLLSGGFRLVGNTAAAGFARMNPDGTCDTTFTPGSGPDQSPNVIVPQADGRILLGGSFYSYNGTAVSNLTRVNSNGTLDTAFNAGLGSGPNGAIKGVAAQTDGKIVIGGSFSGVNNATRNNIARLNADGSLDAGFAPVTDGAVCAVTVDAQGRILIGGTFSLINGQSRSSLARLNPDGTVDGTFNPPTPNGAVNQIIFTASGQIVVAGYFDRMGAVNQNGLARLNASGTLDPVPGQNSPGYVNSIGVQSDGGILLASGSGLYVGTIYYKYLFRLKPDGSVDAAFGPQPNSGVSGVLAGPNNDIYALGSFTTDASEFASGIAHYSGNKPLSVSMTGTNPSGPVTPGTPITLLGTASSAFASVANLNFQFSSDGVTYQLAAVATSQGGNGWTGVWAPPSAGNYCLRLTATDTLGNSGISSSLPFAANAGAPQIGAPSVNINSGTYGTPQTVTISSSSPGVQIYYTTDGSDPSSSSARVFLGTGGTILVSQSTTLNIEAFYGSGNSSRTTATYIITPPNPPTVTFTTPAGYTTHGSFAVQGTAAGGSFSVASAAVSGVTATSVNSFAQWSATVPLSMGGNTLTATVTDTAANTGTASLTINRVQSTAGDDIPDSWKIARGIAATASSPAYLLNYAFNTGPPLGQPNPVLVTVQRNPADGLNYAIVSYPQLIGALDLTYGIQVSSDLVHWTSDGSNYQTVSTTANGDGLTRTATVRILPSVNATSAKFVRVLVTAQ